MEYIKKSLSKPTDWLLLGVVICLIVLVFYNRNVEHATNTNDDDEPPPSTGIPSIPKVNVQVNELPVSQEALRQAIGEVYKADISAIKNLSDIATALQKGDGIKIPGKLVVNGETDLVGSVKKLTVDGDTSLKSKLNVDGDTNLKTKLTVDGDTSLKSKLTVTGETTLANLTASQYVATDANKNLVSVQPAASIISYAFMGGSNTMYANPGEKQITLTGNETGIGITREGNKLINKTGKTVTCLVTSSAICDIDRQGGTSEIKIRKNETDTNMNSYAINPHYSSTDWGFKHTLNNNAIVTLENNAWIDFIWKSSKGGPAMFNFNTTIIGLY